MSNPCSNSSTPHLIVCLLILCNDYPILGLVNTGAKINLTNNQVAKRAGLAMHNLARCGTTQKVLMELPS
ncbi:hypothetical protein PSTG_00096 [Puccinia striiformis f. sp. tritici PST-78]|uniref:Uncharacterized protein n=1 Tax=Puccinia striiformis f. sp. tritici PST-78 TaxID=1165861 RepID=A0A0L0W5I0_9BASI|nr:hypothetical protein PSTG_00096 [Puccinia striiformis f. sp. tritici PST-78]